MELKKDSADQQLMNMILRILTTDTLETEVITDKDRVLLLINRLTARLKALREDLQSIENQFD
jgi:hypothetical protein